MFPKLSPEFVMGTVNLDDGLGTEFSADAANQLIGAITLICKDETRIESGIGEVGFAQQVRSPSHVVDIAWGYICRCRKFRFAVDCQMQFPPESEFRFAVRSFFYAPSGIGVGGLGFATVHPPFESGAFQGKSLTKFRAGFILPSDVGPGNILDQMQEFLRGQPFEESRESGFVRNSLNRVEAADLGNKGIVSQLPNKCSRRAQSQDMLGYERLPKRSVGMPLWASPNRISASKGLNQGGIVQSVKDGLKLFDDGRFLDARTTRAIISSAEGEGLQVRSLGWDGISYRGTVPLLFFYINTLYLVLVVCPWQGSNLQPPLYEKGALSD